MILLHLFIEDFDMTKIIKEILFLSIFVFLWIHIFNILWLTKNPTSYFFDEQKNSIDIVYIGSSNVHNYFNPVLTYELYGYTTGLLTSGAQPFMAIKYLIKEAEKYQNPNLYVIDLYMLHEDFSMDFSDNHVRQVADSVAFSKNRFEMLNEMLNYYNVSKKDYINYYFSFLMYHNSWKNIEIGNFKNSPEWFKGYKGYKGYLFDIGVESQEDNVWSNEVMNLPSENKKVLLDLLDYIKEHNLNVLFVIPKRKYWHPWPEILNYATLMIKEYGINTINFNQVDDLKIDSSKDYVDLGHFNVYGSTKYTLYFAKYLKENYDLPNHRGDKSYTSWEDEYERFQEDFEIKTGQNFDQLLIQYNQLLFGE